MGPRHDKCTGSTCMGLAMFYIPNFVLTEHQGTRRSWMLTLPFKMSTKLGFCSSWVLDLDHEGTENYVVFRSLLVKLRQPQYIHES